MECSFGMSESAEMSERLCQGLLAHAVRLLESACEACEL